MFSGLSRRFTDPPNQTLALPELEGVIASPILSFCWEESCTGVANLFPCQNMDLDDVGLHIDVVAQPLLHCAS